MPVGFLSIRNKVNRKITTEITAFESASLHLQGRKKKGQPVESACRRYGKTA